MTTETDVRCVLEARSLNGESPVWDDRRQRLFWVDIREPALHEFNPADGTDRRWEMPAWIGCIGLGEHEIVVALRTGLHAFDPDTGQLHFFAPPPFGSRAFIFNDGGCDPAGRFIAGTMYVALDPEPTEGPRTSPLWRYDGGGRWVPLSEPVATSNGLAWSPDGRTMYHADTEQHTIWAYDYELESGAASNRRVFAQLDVSDGGPDGAAVDSDGFYWCAVFANGCLLRFDPNGALERRIDLPVRYPTMPAFGGPDLKTIFVTSASWPLPAEERERNRLEGSLFALSAPAPGLPTRRWQAKERVNA
jgi:sugar lactone lactonase YvrE